MLIMSRRQGEVILIGDDIEIVIAHIGRSRVKVGIRAPRATQILAHELKLVRDENMAAAVPAVERAGHLLQLWSSATASNASPDATRRSPPPHPRRGPAS
jgi:carbon storage regulator